MKSVLDFVKKNWLIIGLIVIVLFAWKSKRTDFLGYNHQIKDKNDSIRLLKDQYRLIEEREVASKELILMYEFNLNLYKDSMNVTKKKITNNNVRHAREIANLSRIPTNTLYTDVTGWLDSLSFIW